MLSISFLDNIIEDAFNDEFSTNDDIDAIIQLSFDDFTTDCFVNIFFS